MATKKKYRVLNPNAIPKGVPIMSYGGKHYYEGDVFTPPTGMNLERQLRQGFVEEVA